MSTYSPNLAIELIATGDQPGVWGTTTNTNLGTLIEQAISGYVTQAITNGADTVITIPPGVTGVARNMFIECTGALTAARNLVVPANKKLYFIYNNTSGGFAVTVKVSGLTGVSVPNGKKMVLVSNGTDIVVAQNYLAGDVLGNVTGDLNGNLTAAAPTAATAAPGTNTTQIATTAFSAAAITAERTATATLTNKSLTSPTLTGTPTAPTAAVNTNTTQVATTAFVVAEITASTAGGVNFGMHNRIINGSMMVDQRNSGASQTFTAAAALAYCIDRWYGACTGANVTGQQILVGGTNFYRFTGAAGNTGITFAQRIEAKNSRNLANLSCTLSVNLSSSSVTSVSWQAYYANTTDSFGTLASPTRTFISGGTFTINSTPTVYTAGIAMAAAATTGIEIVFSTGSALLGAQTWTIGSVQLEPGTVATPIEYRPYNLELSLCQRYYANNGGTGCPVYLYGSASNGNQFGASGALPVEMRATPTLTSISSTTANLGALTVTAIGNSAFFVSGTAVTTTATSIAATYSASAEL